MSVRFRQSPEVDLAVRHTRLFELQHRDGAQMTTVGGIVVSWRQLEPLERVLDHPAAALFAGAGVHREVIDLVPITVKEKMALDRLLPCDEAEFLARLTASGIKLDSAEANKYRRWYNHFPVFAETVG